MTMLQSEQIFTLLLDSIVLFIYIPIVLYYIKIYYDNRHNIVLEKRYANINLIFTSFLSCLIVSAMMYPGGYTNIYPEIIAEKFFYVMTMCGYGIIYTLFVRLWMYYFDIQYDKNVYESEWNDLLNNFNNNSTAVSTTMNFFALNKSTFGNLKYIYKYFLVIWLVSSLMPIILYEIKAITNISDYYDNLWNACNMMFIITSVLIPCIAIGILYFSLFLLLKIQVLYTKI